MEDGENNEHLSNLSNTSDDSEETEVGSSNVATKKSRGKVFKVKCGFPKCNSKPMLQQNLKSHTKNHHGSDVPRIQGQLTLDKMFLKAEGI